MAFVSAKCTQCGGQIDVDDTKDAGICKHCGMAFVTEKVIKNYNYTSNYNITNNITKIINGKDSDEAEDFFNRGLTNLKLENYNKALDNFEKAIDKAPEVAKYYFYVAYVESDKMKNIEIFTNLLKPFYKLANQVELEKLSQEYGLSLKKGVEVVEKELVIRKIKNEEFQSVFSNIDNYVEFMNKLSIEEKKEIIPYVEKWLKNLSKNPPEYLIQIVKYNIDNDLYKYSKEFKSLNNKYKFLNSDNYIELYLSIACGYDINDIKEAAKEYNLKNEKKMLKQKKNVSKLGKTSLILFVIGISIIIWVFIAVI
ncbi:MAG: hypothetical protein IKJ33_03830 [Clostridia bacterium]|nr:hypothetical protein [Clostridia bacterium]